MQGIEKNRRIHPKQSQLITINNYNKFYPQKLPSETLSSTQLKFEKSGNEVNYSLFGHDSNLGTSNVSISIN